MIKLNRALCTECQICMIICSWTHFGENTTKRSRIFVDAKWPEMPAVNVCLACPNHECVTACPHDALSWENWIQLDEKRCDGCGACVEACPVLINPLDPILKMRRYEILTQSAGPADWLPMFTSIENSGSVWQVPDERIKWAKDALDTES